MNELENAPLTQDAPGAQAPSPSARTLVLGPMPVGADPRRVLALGPWCFAGREEFFPDWDEAFALAPEPLADREAQKLALAESMALASSVIPRLAERLAPERPLPEAYWEVLLAPHVINVARILTELWHRLRAAIDAHGDEPLVAEVLPEGCSFVMGTDADVVLHGVLNPLCLQWILSRLLPPVLPKAWTLRPLPPVEERHVSDGPKTLRETLRNFVRRRLLRLPFPPIKGVSPAKALRYSLALRHPSKGDCRSRPLRGCVPVPPPDLPVDPIVIFLDLLPQSVRGLAHPECPAPLAEPRVRVASILMYEDAEYRQSLALWRARGGRIACVQHGGNYGMMERVCAAEFVEYSQHAFLSWGWTRHEGAMRGAPNVIPVPAPQLVRLRGRWRGRGRHILFVGTEMPMVGYQMDSHPTPMQNVLYREDKRWFLEALSPARRELVLYRPYFPVPCTLDDASWLLPRFPHVRLCAGPLTPKLLSCRLLVLDHHGTTLLEAMAADVPTVCYWDPESWPLSPDFADAVRRLGEAGVWHSTAEGAAEKVEAVWDDVLAWWRSAPVREARRAFLDAFANCPSSGAADAVWLDVLRHL